MKLKFKKKDYGNKEIYNVVSNGETFLGTIEFSTSGLPSFAVDVKSLTLEEIEQLTKFMRKFTNDKRTGNGTT